MRNVCPTCGAALSESDSGTQHTRNETHHPVGSADEDGDGTAVLAVLNHQHAVLRGTKRDLTHNASITKFLCGELTEPRHDTTPGCYGNQLEDKTTAAIML